MVAIQVKPRISIYLKQRICQLRLINLGKPFSIDKILNQVFLEGWDPLPSRGTVQNIVHNLDQVKSEKKFFDRQFMWANLSVSGVPWDSGEVVLRCNKEFDLLARNMKEKFGYTNYFTNRLANWCWKTFLASQDLGFTEVLKLAWYYSEEDSLNDLIEWGVLSPKEKPSFFDSNNNDIRFFNGLLTYKPWSSSEALEEFVNSVPDSIPFPDNPNWISYAYCLGVTPQTGTNFNAFNRNKVIDFPPPELLDKSGNQKWRERLKVNFGIG